MVQSQQVNPSKWGLIIISPKLNKPPVTYEIFLNSTTIPQTTTANYLGFIKDSNQKFHHHILLFEQKISRTMKILSKL